MPKLRKIDLKKVVDCNHPDINTCSSYLVKIYGHWYAGKFSRQWYGLNFDDWGTSGIQLNHGITEIYQISRR